MVIPLVWGADCLTDATAILRPYTILLLHPFNRLFSRVSRYQKGKTSLDLNEARDDGVWGWSGISWTICKQSAPCSRQITTLTPHHLIFTGLSDAQPTVSKPWSHSLIPYLNRIHLNLLDYTECHIAAGRLFKVWYQFVLDNRSLNGYLSLFLCLFVFHERVSV